MRVACVLVTHLRATHLRAKVEMGRQPHLRDLAVMIVDRSKGRPLVVDRFPAAAGVAAGMTLEQALSRNADGPVLEADEAAYRRVFHQVLLSLQGVSDRVEGAGLGTAYVRLDGLEAMYGGEDPLVAGPAERRSPGPAAAGGRGRRQVPRPRLRPEQPGLGSNLGPAGRGRFPGAPPGGPAPGPRRSRDGDAPLRPAHPGRRGGHEAGDPQRPLRTCGQPGLGALHGPGQQPLHPP